MLASIPARTLNPIRSRWGIPRFSLFGKCSKDKVSAERFQALVNNSSNLDEVEKPDFHFLTADEREILEEAIGIEELKANRIFRAERRCLRETHQSRDCQFADTGMQAHADGHAQTRLHAAAFSGMFVRYLWYSWREGRLINVNVLRGRPRLTKKAPAITPGLGVGICDRN
jgi:hypothetical protein